MVPGRTKAWNKYIGEWIFSRIEKVVPASPVDHTRRISNEVRVPTPTSTPVYGSMENLYGTGSRCVCVCVFVYVYAWICD